MTEKMYIQGEGEIEKTLKHIGFDSLEQAEKCCGRNIYALKLDYYDGVITNVKAVHDCRDISAYNSTQLTDKNNKLTDNMIENIEYFRSNNTQILYQFCCDYYCGQASYGYKLMYAIRHRLDRLIGAEKRNQIFNDREKYHALRDTYEYKQLAAIYGDKI